MAKTHSLSMISGAAGAEEKKLGTSPKRLATGGSLSPRVAAIGGFLITQRFTEDTDRVGPLLQHPSEWLNGPTLTCVSVPTLWPGMLNGLRSIGRPIAMSA